MRRRGSLFVVGHRIVFAVTASKAWIILMGPSTEYMSLLLDILRYNRA